MLEPRVLTIWELADIEAEGFFDEDVGRGTGFKMLFFYLSICDMAPMLNFIDARSLEVLSDIMSYWHF